jgi:hypothetical protein
VKERILQTLNDLRKYALMKQFEVALITMKRTATDALCQFGDLIEHE